MVAIYWTTGIGLRAFEIDFAAEIIVEDVDDAFDERILFQLRHGQELPHAHRAGSILSEEAKNKTDFSNFLKGYFVSKSE